MAKRGPRRLKIGVQSRFGPNSTVELEAVFRKKIWGGLVHNHSHKIVAALSLPAPATATITCPKRNSVVTADTLNLNQAQQINVPRSLQLLKNFHKHIF